MSFLSKVRIQAVSRANPAEQGLKRAYYILLAVAANVSRANPAEQGLKRQAGLGPAADEEPGLKS